MRARHTRCAFTLATRAEDTWLPFATNHQQASSRVGDQIEPTHGIEGASAHEHEHLWTVVGVMKRTNTPIDRVVFINLDSFYRIYDHALGALIPSTGEVGLSTSEP